MNKVTFSVHGAGDVVSRYKVGTITTCHYYTPWWYGLIVSRVTNTGRSIVVMPLDNYYYIRLDCLPDIRPMVALYLVCVRFKVVRAYCVGCPNLI